MTNVSRTVDPWEKKVECASRSRKKIGSSVLYYDKLPCNQHSVIDVPSAIQGLRLELRPTGTAATWYSLERDSTDCLRTVIATEAAVYVPGPSMKSATQPSS